MNLHIPFILTHHQQTYIKKLMYRYREHLKKTVYFCVCLYLSLFNITHKPMIYIKEKLKNIFLVTDIIWQDFAQCWRVKGQRFTNERVTKVTF